MSRLFFRSSNGCFLQSSTTSSTCPHQRRSLATFQSKWTYTDSPYKVLGVTKTTSKGDMKAAYFKLAKESHPDLNPNNPKAKADFQRIAAAYELLDNDELRRAYELRNTGYSYSNYDSSTYNNRSSNTNSSSSNTSDSGQYNREEDDSSEYKPYVSEKDEALDTIRMVILSFNAIAIFLWLRYTLEHPPNNGPQWYERKYHNYGPAKQRQQQANMNREKENSKKRA